MDSLGGFQTVKLHKEFQYVYNKGKSQHSSNVVLFFLPQQGTHKIGFTATKKIGNAVKRNRAKRRLRALFTDISFSLRDGIYIFVAKQSIIEALHDDLSRDFKKVLSRAKAFR